MSIQLEVTFILKHQIANIFLRSIFIAERITSPPIKYIFLRFQKGVKSAKHRFIGILSFQPTTLEQFNKTPADLLSRRRCREKPAKGQLLPEILVVNSR